MEYPTSGTAGYHTYNLSVLTSLLELGADVHLAATATRTKKLIERIPQGRNPGTLTVSGIGLLRLGNYLLLAANPRGFAGWLYRKLKHLKKNRQSPKGRVAIIGRHILPHEARYIEDLSKQWKPDIVLLDTIFSASAHQSIQHIPAIIVAHDVFHERTSSLIMAGLEPSPHIDKSTEQKLLRTAAGLIAISEHDAVNLRQLRPDAIISIFSPPIGEIRSMVDTSPNLTEPSIFYMGSAANHNIQGMRWFLVEVWPKVRAHHPNMTLRVAGDIGTHLPPTPGMRKLGRVDDPAIAAQGCFAAIDPVQAGSGVKIKITSYLALGLPCITTEHGAKGLETHASHIHQANTPSDFCSAIDHALLECFNEKRVEPAHSDRSGIEAIADQIKVILKENSNA